MSKVFELLRSRIKADKKMLIIMIVALSGIVLLMFSEFSDPEDDAFEEEGYNNSTLNFSDYEKNTEERLKKLLEQINGAGKVEVMITVESGDEKIYATQSKKTESGEEKEYVLIESDGTDDGLLLKISQPQIRGVGVVCQGADSPTVRQEMVATVTSVLGISTNRVNIAKMRSDDGG